LWFWQLCSVPFSAIAGLFRMRSLAHALLLRRASGAPLPQRVSVFVSFFASYGWLILD
jgi:hypothetical protein